MHVLLYLDAFFYRFLSRYYKKFNIPDMIRHELALDAKSISTAHANNTLIIKVKYFLLIKGNFSSE